MLLDCNIVDIHAHLLPGLDDGPESTEEALRMCRAYLATGVRAVVATPHMADHRYAVTPLEVRDGVRRLRQLCEQESIPSRYCPARTCACSPRSSRTWTPAAC